MMSGKIRLYLVVTLVFLWGPLAAQAASYPDKPVALVTAFTTGGPSDLLAQIVSKQLSAILGQPFTVEPHPGNNGNTAAAFVAHAAPDGYTLLLGNNSILATNVSLYRKLPYDPLKDFAPITLIGSQANILVVSPMEKIDSLAQLVALAKSKPGKLTFASTSFGAAADMAGELFKSAAGINITVAPYDGAGPALKDVVAGKVDIIFASSASVIGQIRSGALRPLAVTSSKRTALFPDIPTIAELGYPGFDATSWHGLVAPAGTPPAVIETLNRVALEALGDAGVRKSLADLGVDVAGTSPQQFDAYIKSEIPKWAAIVKNSGMPLQ